MSLVCNAVAEEWETGGEGIPACYCGSFVATFTRRTVLANSSNDVNSTSHEQIVFL